jgi:arsenate reductase-like glutaredoxin family protein
MKENNNTHSFEEYIEKRLTKEQIESIYNTAEEEVKDIIKELNERGSNTSQ